MSETLVGSVAFTEMEMLKWYDTGGLQMRET